GNGTCSGGDPAALNFDLETVPVSAEVTVDCLPAVRSCLTFGLETLHEPVFVECDRDGDRSMLKVSCDAKRWTVNGSALRGSVPERIAFALSALISGSADPIAQPVDGGVLDFRTPAAPPPPRYVRLSGEVTLNGAPIPPCSSADPGSIWFSGGGGILRTCDGRSGWSFSVDVPAGTYDVWVYPPYGMHGRSQRVQSGLSADGDLSGLQFDLQQYPVFGVVTVNGAPMLDCSNAQFDLAEPGSPLLYGPGASVVQNGQTCGRDGLSFSVLRPPGRYRAIVSVPP